MTAPAKRKTNFKLAPGRAQPKKARTIGGEVTWADGSARAIANHLAQERAGGGEGYLSTRADQRRRGGDVRSLSEIALRGTALGLLETLSVGRSDLEEDDPKLLSMSKRLGFDPVKHFSVDRLAEVEELNAIRDSLQRLPQETRNRLLEMVIILSGQKLVSGTREEQPMSLTKLARVFLHEGTTSLRLSAHLSASDALLTRIPSCTHLTSLDLAGHTGVRDASLAKMFAELKALKKVNLRQCQNAGDRAVIAFTKASGDTLRDVNLSFTAVTVKGLTSLLARCKYLEVLKMASVGDLKESAINKLVDDSTSLAVGWKHVPLSNLRRLKLRGTLLTDAALGRLLTLCGMTLVSLDIGNSLVKSLDTLALNLHLLPTWRLEKLVISGLPLSSATLENFFKPLAERTEEERGVFKTLKMAAMKVNTREGGLTDSLLARLIPHWEKLGLERISLGGNTSLGQYIQPMGRFVEVFGRRCTTLDLSLPLKDHHLEFLLPPAPDTVALEGEDTSAGLPYPPRLKVLVLDGSRISDASSAAIGKCSDLRLLHLAETKISTGFLLRVLQTCPMISSLNLTSCRGVPVTQRRTFFEALARGEVEP